MGIYRCGQMQKIHAANISLYFVTLVPPNTSDIGILSSISSVFFTSSGVNKISDAPAFSFKRSSFLVPGIGTRYGFYQPTMPEKSGQLSHSFLLQMPVSTLKTPDFLVRIFWNCGIIDRQSVFFSKQIVHCIYQTKIQFVQW